MYGLTKTVTLRCAAGGSLHTLRSPRVLWVAIPDACAEGDGAGASGKTASVREDCLKEAETGEMAHTGFATEVVEQPVEDVFSERAEGTARSHREAATDGEAYAEPVGALPVLPETGSGQARIRESMEEGKKG